MMKNLYRWLWARIGGRPWTYISRDIYHKFEYIWLVGLFISGFAVGISRLVSWKWLIIIIAVYTIGYIHGHFFWTENYIEGQKIGDTVGLSYLAGLFDGEGSIIIKVKSYKTGLHHTIQCSMGSNTKESILLYFNRFGGNIWSDKTKPSRANFNQWHWEITANQGASFLKEIYPFLKFKKAEALVAIDFQEKKHSLSFTERERERHYLHSLKGNRRILKEYIPS